MVPTQLQFDLNIERASGSTSCLPVDPYQFRDGIVPDEEIADLRRRRKGKALAKYQLRQNDVCVSQCSAFALTTMTPTAHFGFAETNGRAH